MNGSSAPMAGVLGWPVRHSLSPRLHGHWLKRYDLPGSYEHLPVPPELFEGYVRALATNGYAGANVTLPHKEAALALCDEVDPAARAIGAVNTLIFRDGRIEGQNSDAFGFLESLRQDLPAWKPSTGPAVVLGAGGAARAIVFALKSAGVSEIRVVNRSAARAERLVADFGSSVTARPWTAAGLVDTCLLVNATSLGMAGQPPLELDLQSLPSTAAVADIVYQPLRTELLSRASAAGHATMDGLGMLLHQARPGFEAWFSHRPEVDAALRAAVLEGLT
ncbi:shikimate dehydrogenase [Algihabitans sp.]|uniref:shikimate dehydrogenase n=1 Tax=Algihabitans sp. TaxID=2821514 RepID=UPI003BADA6E3